MNPTMDESLRNWPFPERRFPRSDDPDYLGSKGLSVFLRQVIATELAGKRDLDILDVGCGRKPFYPFFQPFARSYIGTDILTDNSLVDKVCPVEELAVPDESADLVLCLSVLEHVNDPRKSVSELARAVRRGGQVWASTHGCFPWHPYPQDHWRWTQTGLELLFRGTGVFASTRVFATRGSLSGIFFLLAHYGYSWASQTRWRMPIRGAVTRALNVVGERLDRWTPGLRDLRRPVTAIPEFFVIAERG
jgi:SAM-dependent methyltransferase